MKRFLSLVLTLLLLTFAAAALAEDAKPATWIADRTIAVQCYVNDVGYSRPKYGIENTPVGKELKARTGITLEIRYTEGEKDVMVLSAQLAAGYIPDAIISYLDNSTRPEFPILLKAAQEGLFVDLTNMLPNTKVFKQYLDKDYLGYDSYKNIVHREDLNGIYLLHMSVPHVDESLIYQPDNEYVGGPYIRADIAKALNINPNDIHTSDDLYHVLVAIRDGNFKDDNGNPIIPLGPRYWSGSVDAMPAIAPDLFFAINNGLYGPDENGQFKHEAETEWFPKRVQYVRKLLKEGLMHQEFFTMDQTRAEELCRNHGCGVIASIHNYTDVISTNNDWLPIRYLQNRTGYIGAYSSGKGGYGCLAISANAKNPEEILAFFDYLSTYEGQLLGAYGVEGLSYTMQNGYPVLTPETRAHLEAKDSDWLINQIGASFGGAGCCFWDLASTDGQNKQYFGETRVGASSENTFKHSVELAEQYPIKRTLVKGLDAASYLSLEQFSEIKTNLDLMDYRDTFVQACYTETDQQVDAIINNFRERLKAAGVETFENYLNDLYKKDPDSIMTFRSNGEEAASSDSASSNSASDTAPVPAPAPVPVSASDSGKEGTK